MTESRPLPARPAVAPLGRRLLAEFLGTGLLVTVVVGSGIAAQQLSPGDTRAAGGHLLGEVVATAGLIVLIFALARTSRGVLAAPAVGAYIGAAYWFTSSTSFANPAVTIGRTFSDTFAGIAPASVAPFIGMQVIGTAVGMVLVLILYPGVGATADDIVIPHPAPADS